MQRVINNAGSRSNSRTTHANAGIAAWRFKMNAQIGSYEDCQRAMEHLGDSSGFAKIGPNMTLIHEGHALDDQASRTYAVELYSTKIIRYYPDGTFSVDSGGFNTPTTRERLNAVLPERYGNHRGGNGAAYFDKKQLGVAGLWPLDHSKRIDIKTGGIVAREG